MTIHRFRGRTLSLLLAAGSLALSTACSAQSAADSDAMATMAAPASVEALDDYLSRPPEDDVVYFMLPDRFENGDTSNDRGGLSGDRLEHGYDPTHKGFYHGGDLVGLTSRLDYIRGMGATAIWLGPIYKNKPVQGGEGQESAGYHGYWITDFTSVDPHLGTNAELKTFVEEAHKRDMKVYLDIITNHTADVISFRECHDPDHPDYIDPQGDCPYRSQADYPYTTRGGPDGAPINAGFMGVEDHHQTRENFAHLSDPDYAYTTYVPDAEKDVKIPAWLNDVTYYHNRGDSHWKGESSLNGDFVGLDDLMTEHPVVVEGMTEIFKDWITDYKLDGFRIDTAKHVNPNFWKQFLPAIKAHAASEGIPNFYMFGESAYPGEPEMLAWQTKMGGFDQVLDFGFYDVMRRVATGEEPAYAFKKLFDMDDMYRGGQATATRSPTFVGNHDFGRLSGMIKAANPDISQADLLSRTELAHELMMFLRGVPVVYSGDEQGFVSDGNDQLARENMFPSVTDVYNDNDLIGTDATTADSNFDTSHPLYQTIRRAADLRAAHPALRRGVQVPRYMDEDGFVLAVSRFDPETAHEYLIAGNLGGTARRVNIEIDPLSSDMAAYAGDCGEMRTAGVLSLDLPAYGLAVCRSATASSRQDR